MRETGVKNHVCLPFHDVTDNGDGVAGVRDALLFVRSLGVGAKRNGSGEPLLPSRLSLPSFPVPSPSSRRRLVALLLTRPSSGDACSSLALFYFYSLGSPFGASECAFHCRRGTSFNQRPTGLLIHKTTATQEQKHEAGAKRKTYYKSHDKSHDKKSMKIVSDLRQLGM